MLLVNNDNLIRLLECADKRGGTPSTTPPITTATVTARITDTNGDPVGSDIPLLPIPGVPGEYEGVAPASLPLIAEQFYTVQVTATDGPGRQGVWRVRSLAQVRHDT